MAALRSEDASLRTARVARDADPSVLVVQGHNLHRIVQEAVLSRTFRHVTSCTQADEAEAATDLRSFDVVFVELGANPRAGITLLRRLRARGMRAPAVMAFGAEIDPGISDVLTLGSLGVAAVLRAPYSLESLEATLLHAVDARV